MRIARTTPSTFDQGDEHTVAVIGAGIAGLSAAWALRRAGIPVIVLESAARVGGVIATQHRGDFLVELGPTSALVTPELTQLIAELGLTAQMVGPSPGAHKRFVARGGRAIAVPMSPPALMATPLLSLGGKLRVLGDLFIPRARAGAPEESVGALARRRFGSEATDYLIDPMIGGIYAGDPDRLSSHHTVRALYDMEQTHGSVIRGAVAAAKARRNSSRDGKASGSRTMFSFRGGLRELPDSMASALGDSIRLGTRVIALEHDGERWHLECESPDGTQHIAVHAVVSTIPAFALAEIELPTALRAVMEPTAQLSDVPVATLALGFRRSDVAHPLDGFGVLVPHAECCGILGALFSSSIFEARAPAGMTLITCMIGGARDRLAASEDENALVRRALAALGPLLGITGAPTFVHGMQWAHAIPQYEIGHGGVVAAVNVAEEQFGGLILAGSYRDGVSIGDRVRSGLRAGDRAAALGPYAMEARRLG